MAKALMGSSRFFDGADESLERAGRRLSGATVTLSVTFAAGAGRPIITGRIRSRHFNHHLGQTFVVENRRGGAGGTVERFAPLVRKKATDIRSCPVTRHQALAPALPIWATTRRGFEPIWTERRIS